MAATRRNANGNGTAKAPATPKLNEILEETENIFLFIPNLIGQEKSPQCPSGVKQLTLRNRILSNRPRPRIPLLHAPPPSNLLRPILHIMSPGRSRRLRSSQIQPIHKVWCSTRYGH
jgi:hypothetical protein